jgi:hypothetical protein
LNADLNGLNDASKHHLNAYPNALNAGLNVRQNDPNTHPNVHQNGASNGLNGAHLNAPNVQPNADPNAQTFGLNTANDVRSDDKEDAMKALLAFYQGKPGGSYSEAASVIGRSKGTIAGYVRELEERGCIVRANGQVLVKEEV